MNVSTLVNLSSSINEEVAGGETYAMPASPLQVRLWNLNEAAPDPAWNVAVRFRLLGPLDRETFERALQALTERHEALRTSFAVHPGGLVERIAPRVTLPVEWCDLRSLDEETQAAELLHLSMEHARQILSMAKAPLLRVRVLRLGDEEHILLWNAHLSICDGWSVGLLSKDLMDCYGELSHGREPATRNSLDYGDYAVWLDAQRKTAEYETHRSYWKQRMQGLRVSDLPDEWHASDTSGGSPALQSIVLPRDLTDSLLAIAQRNHATFFHAVLAAFGLLMRTHQSSPQVAVETPMSGRDQSELEGIVGAFVNTLPIDFSVHAQTQFSKLLLVVRDRVTGSLEHAQFRYEDMLTDRENDREAVPTGQWPIPVTFICQQDFVRPIAAGNVELTAIPSVSPGALHPLTVFLVERADGWRLSCEVDNRRVSQATGSNLLGDFRRILTAIVAAPEESVLRLVTQAGLAMASVSEDSEVDGSQSELNATAEDSEISPVLIPATEFQQRFFRLDSLNPGAVAFHVRVRLELKGELNVDALAHAVSRVAQRNEILRTSLEQRDGRIWQAIHPELSIDFRLLVSETLVPDAQRSDAQRQADQSVLDREGQAGFSLSTGGMFRVRLLKLEAERYWLAITLSHGIIDGWSTGLFLQQLQEEYELAISGAGNNADRNAVQFSVYAKLEQQLLSSPEKNVRLAWWRKYLGGVWTPLALPQDGTEFDTDASEARAGLEIAQLDSEVVAAAKRFARECQVTPFAVFGALFQSLLARYSRQNDVLFLTPHANRSSKTESIMGPIADSICLTGHIGADTTFRELVTRFGKQSMDAMVHDVPLNLLTPLVEMEVGPQYHPLNQITFFYQRAFVHDMEWKDLRIASLPDVPSVTETEWQLGVVERKAGVALELLYDATLYSPTTIQTVQRHFARLLSQAMTLPDAPVMQLEILTKEEVKRYSASVTPLPPVIECLLPHKRLRIVEAVPEAASEIAAPVANDTLSSSERDMLSIWQKVLKVDDLTMESNFFDVGGHSLLLTRIQRMLKHDFGVQLTAATVFRHPTLGAQAQWLDQARRTVQQTAKVPVRSAWEQNPRIIPLQPHGDGCPIFVISQSMIFRALAGELGSSQPVYALQMPDEDVVAAAATYKYEDLIDFYVRLIREVQPSGPYRVSGWCVSGWVAYGVARRLEEDGETIELLTVIDVCAPGYWLYQPKIRRSLMMAVYKFQRSRILVRRLMRRDMAQPRPSKSTGWPSFCVFVGNVAAWLRQRKDSALTPLEAGMQQSREQLESTAYRARWAGNLKGTALFFRSEEEPSGPLLDAEMGWPAMLGRPVHVEEIPGNHREIFNPLGARMMAHRIREVLGLAEDSDGMKKTPERRATTVQSPRDQSMRVVG